MTKYLLIEKSVIENRIKELNLDYHSKLFSQGEISGNRIRKDELENLQSKAKEVEMVYTKEIIDKLSYHFGTTETQGGYGMDDIIDYISQQNYQLFK